MLKNPFYYGELEYPVGSGNWYKGKHEPLVTKELFDKVQEKLAVPAKSKWGSKSFTYKGILKCANCKSTVIAEERFRERKYGKPPRRHVYYHCSRQKDYNCKEPYVTEKKLEEGMENFRKLREEILLQQDINPNSQLWDIRDYAKYVLANGEPKMKRELFNMFDYQFYLQNRMITTLRAH